MGWFHQPPPTSAVYHLFRDCRREDAYKRHMCLCIFVHTYCGGSMWKQSGQRHLCRGDDKNRTRTFRETSSLVVDAYRRPWNSKVERAALPPLSVREFVCALRVSLPWCLSSNCVKLFAKRSKPSRVSRPEITRGSSRRRFSFAVARVSGKTRCEKQREKKKERIDGNSRDVASSDRIWYRFRWRRVYVLFVTYDSLRRISTTSGFLMYR